MGAIAPGFRADFILLDDLKSFRISDVFLNGKRIDLNYSGGRGDGINSSQIGIKVKGMTSDIWVNSDDTQLLQSTASSSLSILQNNTMRIKSLDDPNIFSTPAKPTTSSSLASIQVIGVIPGQLITQK
jgi:adenine deaminase